MAGRRLCVPDASERSAVFARRSGRALGLAALALLGTLVLSPPATAFEAFDGRFAAHGFFESQFRAISRDYSEDWDATQWYMVFNVELELDLVQDRIGPIDLLSAYVRAEVRYDCIYSRGCGMFRSMNAYGDRSKSLPRRLLEQDRVTHSGRIRVQNDDDVPDQYREYTIEGGTNTDPVQALNSPTLGVLANGAGGDGISPRDELVEGCTLGGVCSFLAGGDGTTSQGFDTQAIWSEKDNPYENLAREGGYLDTRFVTFDQGVGGPWLPKNKFITNGMNRGSPNPWDDRVASYSLRASIYNSTLLAANEAAIENGTPFFDPNTGEVIPGQEPALTAALVAATAAGLDPAVAGSGELPYRPVPLAREQGAGVDQAANPGDPRGLFIPSEFLAKKLDNGSIEGLEGDYNFSENERAWNRGSSQKDEKELKEAYLDIEMFDHRLWLRVGRQQIVWGKTELFRTTDQFNPTDQSLASLPSLEESRIALWSARGVWSFYDIGPFEDVRLEVAINFDDFQQIDLGACGEPYAVNLTCALSLGAWAHGALGVGIAGVENPPDPWESFKGWEIGGRIEWRWERFSFALSDYYGYDDFPTISKLSTFVRNVDPISGRPRRIFDSLRTTSGTNPYAFVNDPDTLLEVFRARDAITQVGASQGPCVNGDEPSCLAPKFFFDPTPGDPSDDPPPNPEALRSSSVAQQVFAYTCATSAGFTDLDPTACALNLFGSPQVLDPDALVPIPISQGLGGILAGSPLVNRGLAEGTRPADTQQALPGQLFRPGGFVFPLARLSVDPGDLDFDPATGAGPGNPATNGAPDRDGDGRPDPCQSPTTGDFCGGQAGLLSIFTTTSAAGDVVVAQTLGGTLSPTQEALLGCGPYWGTQCDVDGIDLLHAEGSALYQSWPGVEGTVQNGDIFTPWLTNQRVTLTDDLGNSVETFAAQPGTRNWYFDRAQVEGQFLNLRPHLRGPVCTTADFGGPIFADSADPLRNDTVNGNQAVLPGCRRKWKREPIAEMIPPGLDPTQTAEFLADYELESLNVYGRDLDCVEAYANDPSRVPADCFQGADTDGDGALSRNEVINSPRVDPRSWSINADGDPDRVNMQNIDFGATPADRTVFLPTPRTVDGQRTAVPDFFYSFPGFQRVYGVRNDPITQPNPVVGDAFDRCDAANYPADVIAEYGSAQFVPCGRGGHPMTGQPFASEMAALSWNFLALLVQQDGQVIFEEQLEALGIPLDCTDIGANPRPPTLAHCSLPPDERDEIVYEIARGVFLNPEACSFVQPALCETFRTLQGAIGLQRNIRRAGGNGNHGRRTFTWQSGGEAYLTYNKRNVLGFSMDFAEDLSKANFNFEFTWIEGVEVANNLEYDGISRTDEFNLSVSVDRPTFINFLNANRTFFFNAQFFARYRSDWEKGYTDEGAWSFVGTFTVATAYFQDRLTPAFTTVYDVRTQSGAFLSSISYRFTENFSAQVGGAWFFGKPDQTDEQLAGFQPAGNRNAQSLEDLYKVRRQGGLSIIRERDEVFFRLRYAF